MPVPLALIRAHLSLDDDRDPELLTHYANVAAAWVQAYTGQPFALDNPIMVQAALLMVAHQYVARVAVILSCFKYSTSAARGRPSSSPG